MNWYNVLMGFELSPQSVPTKEKLNQNRERKLDGSLELGQKIIEEAEKIEIRENDRNEKGELLVFPNGPVSNLGEQNELYWKIVRTETFKAFFGDWQNDAKFASKILDQNGEPLVVFRGERFGKNRGVTDLYDPNNWDEKHREYQREVSHYGEGIYFTPDPHIAFGFAGNNIPSDNNGTVLSAFINSRNPKYSNFITQNIREAVDMVRPAYVFIQKKLLKYIPRATSNISKHDSVLGKSNNLLKSYTKNPEEVYELVVKDTRNVLVIPSPVKKPEKLVAEYAKDLRQYYKKLYGKDIFE